MNASGKGLSRILTLLSLAAVVFFSAWSNQCPAGSTILARQSNATEFSCPMHPEVKSVSATSCPKCGMRLTPVAVDADRDGAAEPKDNFSGSALTIRIPDVVVYDQDGRRLKFYSDLIKGKTVAINFIFTTCTTICPPLTATMRQVQKQMGERVGRDVWLVSVSVDPLTDVPERLKSFSVKFGAGSGWTFVTGSKSEIDRLLKALGGYASDKNNHSPIILIGNEPVGYWTRSYGLSPATTVARLIAEVADRKIANESSTSASKKIVTPR
jgi:cytochrome oxidase Cu insertion factor (SCO1/SenC/PrrC family)